MSQRNPDNIRPSKRQQGDDPTPMLQKVSKKRKPRGQKRGGDGDGDVESSQVVGRIDKLQDTEVEEQEIEAEHREQEEEVEEEQEQEEVAEYVSPHIQEEPVAGSTDEVQPEKSDGNKKKTRGRTRMRRVATQPDELLDIEFESIGEHVGSGSVTLSSFLGILVREHVPVLLDDWRYLKAATKDAMWEEIKARFNLNEEWQKDCVFRQMNNSWRSHKSKLSTLVRATTSKTEILQLRPSNIPSVTAWKKWVNSRKSSAFKDISDKYRKMRESQIPQTSGRKGFVRLAHDMKKKSSNPADVTRSKIWLAGHTHADGRLVRPEFQDTIEQIKSIDSEVGSTAGNNIREDAVSKVLGKDKPGRIRGLGRGVTATKLAFLGAKDAHVKNLEAQQADMLRKFQEFKNEVKNQLATGIKIDDASRAESREVTQDTAEGTWCQILDWYSKEDVVVGEGEFCSVDPVYKIGRIAIGPNAAAIYLKSATVAVASLWRPTSDANNVGEAVGTQIAWPPQKVKLYKEASDNNATSSSTVNESMDKIYIYGWNLVDTIVAEGRMVSSDPEEIVNNIPIGPNAAVVIVEMVIEKKACLWRPSTDLRVIGDALHERIVWPLDKVDPIIAPSIRSSHVSTNSHNTSSTQSAQKKKCYLIDCSNPGLKVAEGRVWSSNPTDIVHHKSLGPNASKVSVDVPLVGNAKVWKPSSEFQTIDDALGSLVAWPSDKLVFM